MTASAITALRAADWASHVRIETDDGPRLLAVCEDGWQRIDREAAENGWRVVVGLPPIEGQPTYRRLWHERARGHDKTGGISLQGTRAILISQAPIQGIVCAADRDQAAIYREKVLSHVRANNWGELIDVQRFAIVNRVTGSTITILSSDVPSSFGLTPNFVCCDELVHWQNADLWHSLISAAAKRANCLVSCITNSGFQESWQWDTREAIRTDDAWYFSRLDGPVASWITPDRLDEQRRLLPDVVFRRLWLNQWASGAGDALRQEDIEAAFRDDLFPLPGWASGHSSFVGGLDLSVSRDFSAFVVVAKTSAGRYRLAYHRLWRPPAGGKIDQQQIEDCIVAVHRRFRLHSIASDPFQAEGLVSRLRKANIPISVRHQQGKQLVEQAMMLVEVFSSRAIDLYRSDDLEQQLRKLRVEEKSYGLRLVSDRTAGGHGDLVTALSIALATAKPVSAGMHDLSDWMSPVKEQRIRQLGVQRREQEAFSRWNRPVDEREIRKPWTGGV